MIEVFTKNAKNLYRTITMGYMAYMRGCILLCMVAVVALHAQSLGGSARSGLSSPSAAGAINAFGSSGDASGRPKRGSADDDWVALVSFAFAAPSSANGATKTLAQRAADRAQQIAQLRQAAQAARDFYTRYPGDPRGMEARKLEAISALHGIERGDKTQEEAAIATAQAFRMNAMVPAKDRFEVAVAMDGQDLSLRRAARIVANSANEEKKLVDKWRLEFGDLPEISNYAIRVARRADPLTSAALASDILRSAAAPDRAKAEAKAIVERAHLLGSVIHLNLPLLDGGSLDLAQQRDHVTLLIAWSAAEPDTIEFLEALQKPLPRGAQLICLAVGGTMSEVMSARHHLPRISAHAHLAEGAAVELAIATLKLRSVPYVYVLNGKGVVSDFGPLSELPALMNRAGVATIKTSSFHP